MLRLPNNILVQNSILKPSTLNLYFDNDHIVIYKNYKPIYIAIRTFFLINLFLLILNNSHSQTIHLSGVVEFGWGEESELFYTIKGEPFTRAKKVSLVGENEYSLLLTPALLKQAKSKDMVFSNNLTENSENVNLDAVHIGEMFDYMAEIGWTEWNAKHDIKVGSSNEAYGGSRNSDTVFTGGYLLIKNDTLEVELDLTHEYHKFTGNDVTESNIGYSKYGGDWYYTDYNKELVFNVRYYQNERFGLSLYPFEQFSFFANLSSNPPSFKGTGCPSHRRNCYSTVRWKLTKE